MNTRNTIKAAISHAHAARGRKQQIDETIEQLSRRIKRAARKARLIGEAIEVVHETARITQSQLEYYLTHIVTQALEAIFGEDAYKMSLEFTAKKNRMESRFYFIDPRSGEQVVPSKESGEGPVDIASFALRLTLWKISKTAPVIIMDEPFHFLSAQFQSAVGALLKRLSTELGIQVVMVTHRRSIAEHADRVFVVTKRGRRSCVALGNKEHDRTSHNDHEDQEQKD